ncbi:MAG: AtpZ/AtpI family protein [Bacteroidetes bacterium]|nr:AtpZ/AtpI family protein [Bacteroidota bacterium]MCL2303021.1 AtpZ/AtpI family protein [Lentimicrobiaceae bacterium]
MGKNVKKTTPSGGANYLALSFQMGLLIFLAAYGGMKLDQKVGSFHIFAILFSLLAIILSMYYIIRKEIPKKKKDD